MANPEHVEIVKRGAAAIAEWRQEHPRERLFLSEADLSEADLSRADLREGDLREADLSEANLSEANLSGANLGGANLGGANLIEANLIGANLSGADLSRAYISGADLSRAFIIGANFGGADLGGADLSDAVCAFMLFADCDLSRVRSLETVEQMGPSSIGVDTLVLTLHGGGGQFTAEQRTFFGKAGVSKTLLDYLPSLLESQPIQFFSCFISYGGEDVEFAHRLHDDLRGRDIRCWKYDVDAIIGREVWGNISRAIVLHEKMIVICSQSSLERPGVHGEIERALQKEEQLKREQVAKGNAETDTDVLVPVRLDNYILDKWEHPRKADVNKKHIGDFRGWDKDEANYKRGLDQLLRALDPRSRLGLSKGDPRQLEQD